MKSERALQVAPVQRDRAGERQRAGLQRLVTEQPRLLAAAHRHLQRGGGGLPVLEAGLRERS